MRKRVVGVTLHTAPGISIFSNGATQNCFFLIELLRSLPNVEKVYAISDTKEPPPESMLGKLGIELTPPGDVYGELDVLIEAGVQVEPSVVDQIHDRGGRAVAYRFGNAYVIDTEITIHGKPARSIFNGAKFDEVWTNPQHVDTCKSYWEICHRAPVRVMPHIWSPAFVDATIAEFPDTLQWGYQPGRIPKRISIFEPNINIVKTAHIPMLVCEVANRWEPSLIGDIYVTNSLHLKEHETFSRFAKTLTIVQSGKCSFEARYNTPYFLAKYTDIVVSHQWENGLNYAYYDALYGGYPLIHNSKLLPSNIGYQYEGFDARDGSAALIDALKFHDRELDDYKARCATFLKSVDVHNQYILDAHAQALDRLFEI